MLYYPNNYEQNLKNIISEANNQLNQLHAQPTLTQNFQIAPVVSNMRIVNDRQDVERDVVIQDTYFLAKDKMLWIKNARGDVREFTLTEVIQKDEKDLLIEKLQDQIKELKGSMKNGDTSNDATNGNTKADEPVATI